MSESLWLKAVANPWLFICMMIGLALWKSARYLAKRLFDDETGLIPNFVRSMEKNDAEMKKTLVAVQSASSKDISELRIDVVNSLGENREAIEALERQLVNAIQARPDDEELFKVLFDDNPVPICFVGSDGRFTRLNKACEEIWGYSAGELSGMTFADITLEQDIKADLDNVDRVRKGVMSRYRLEKTYVRKDGTHRRCALYVFRYPSRGAFLHFISIIVPL